VIFNIQALRGIAALLVLSVHAFSDRPGLGPDTDWLRMKLWWVGPAGVDVFFVISGFIVTTSALTLADRYAHDRVCALVFAIKRLFRIYPVYWVVFAVSSLLFTWIPTSQGIPDMGFFQKLFAMTVWNDRVVSSWSLFFELFFYASLTLIIAIAPRRILTGLALWCALFIGIVAGTYISQPDAAWTVAQSPLLLEFMFGVFVAYLVNLGADKFGPQCLLIGILWFVISMQANSALGSLAWEPRWRTPLFGIASAFIVYGLVAVEIRQKYQLPRALCRFGDASYSIYIWHQFVIAAALTLCLRLNLFALAPASLFVALWTLVAILVGFLSYKFIERPTMKLADRLVKSIPATPKRSPSDAVTASSL
jgi:peptidoglycan/LPS O-acetylase OafA/YrhL